MEASWNIPITDHMQVGEARRIATALASSLLFNEMDGDKVALAVTEISNTIRRHAGRGELLLRSLHDDIGTGIEVLGVDYSESLPYHHERGVCLVSRVYRSLSALPLPLKQLSYDYGIVSVPHPLGRICGDGYFMHESAGVCTVAIVDGLGPGLYAAETSQKVCQLLEEHVQQPLETLMTILHQGLRDTRGASVAAIRILPDERELRFIGVGNVCGAILQPDGQAASLLPHAGVVGHDLGQVREASYAWFDQALVVLHTAGLQSEWDFTGYPRILFSDASVLAGTLYRDFNRGHDDLTIMTVKAKSNRGFPT